MGSMGSDVPVAKMALGLSKGYESLNIDSKRMVDTLEESCTWGSTSDGGMSE